MGRKRGTQHLKRRKKEPIVREGVRAEDFAEQDGHVIVLTDMGLAMVVAGLRNIAVESPEVEPLLRTLENHLAEGASERKEQLEQSSS